MNMNGVFVSHGGVSIISEMAGPLIRWSADDFLPVEALLNSVVSRRIVFWTLNCSIPLLQYHIHRFGLSLILFRLRSKTFKTSSMHWEIQSNSAWKASMRAVTAWGRGTKPSTNTCTIWKRLDRSHYYRALNIKTVYYTPLEASFTSIKTFVSSELWILTNNR